MTPIEPILNALLQVETRHRESADEEEQKAEAAHKAGDPEKFFAHAQNRSMHFGVGIGLQMAQQALMHAYEIMQSGEAPVKIVH